MYFASFTQFFSSFYFLLRIDKERAVIHTIYLSILSTFIAIAIVSIFYLHVYKSLLRHKSVTRDVKNSQYTINLKRQSYVLTGYLFCISYIYFVF